jgi:hypothetical protein
VNCSSLQRVDGVNIWSDDGKRESNTKLKRENEAPARFVIDLYYLCPKTMKSRFNKMDNKTNHNIEPVPISNIKIVEISKSISLASLLTTNVYSCLGVEKKTMK